MCSAAIRPAWPLASVKQASTTRPFRFSISACAMKQSLASLPGSGWSASGHENLLRGSARRPPSAARPSRPSAESSSSTAQASISVPSTLMLAPEDRLRRSSHRRRAGRRELGARPFPHHQPSASPEGGPIRPPDANDPGGNPHPPLIGLLFRPPPAVHLCSDTRRSELVSQGSVSAKRILNNVEPVQRI